MAINFLNTVAVDESVLFVDTTNDRVGIGTGSPDSLLEISQQLSAAATIDYPYTISSRDDGNSINQLGGEGVGIKFRIAGNAGTTPGDSLVGASIAAIRESSTDTDSSTALGFFVTQNDETLDEAVRIDHDGNVGIGTDSPGVKLHLSTGNSSLPTLDGGTLFVVDATQGGTGNYSAMSILSGTAGISSLYLGDPDAENRGSLRYYNSSNSISIGTNGAERMRITSSGNVGIGTTSPGANLEIRGTVNTDDCKIYLKENSTYGAYFKYDGDLNRGYIGGITGTTSENAVISWSRAGNELKLVTSGSTAVTIDSNRDVTFAEDIIINDVLLSNQVNTDVDTGAEVVAQVAHATYTAAFFDFVVKKGINVRSGTVYACHNGDSTPLVEFTETSTNDLGDTSDVTLSVDISGANMRLVATVTSDDWSVKSLIRAI